MPRLLFAAGLLALGLACTKSKSTPVAEVKPLTTLPLGTQYQVLATGDGKVAKTYDTVSVHYVGSFEDGGVFDSSYKRGLPMKFELGRAHVILGWDEGIPGMREGEKRRLVVPPALGYGRYGKDPIPPMTTMHFDVLLVEVR